MWTDGNPSPLLRLNVFLIRDKVAEICKKGAFNAPENWSERVSGGASLSVSIFVSTEQLLYKATVRLSDGCSASFDLRFLGRNDLPELNAFRDRIFAGLPDIDAYYPEDPEFAGWHLAERGRTLGVLCEGQLMGCAVIGIPLDGMPNFAADIPDLGLDPLAVAHMCSCMVDPRLRGQGLQRLLVSMRVMLAVGLGRPHLLTRVAVINHVSLTNMLACDFVLRRVIVMHGTRLRYVLHRNLTAPPPRWVAAEAIAVPLADIERQRDVLAHGLAGVAVAGPADDRRILFVDVEGDAGQCRDAQLSSMLTPPVC